MAIQIALSHEQSQRLVFTQLALPTKPYKLLAQHNLTASIVRIHWRELTQSDSKHCENSLER